MIIATGTASGKSLGYLLPALTGILEGGTALYIAPTRALAADQLRLVQALRIPGCARRSSTGIPRRPSGVGAGARDLPAHHPGHAASHAAAAACPVERLLPQAPVRDRR